MIQVINAFQIIFTYLIVRAIAIIIVFGFVNSAFGLPQEAPAFTKRYAEIEWDEVPDAIKYELEVYNNKTKKFIKMFSSTTHVFKLNIKLGKYLIRSRITDKFQRESPWSDLTEMTIGPPPTLITSHAPANNTPIYGNKKTGVADIPIKWNPLPFIDKYLLIVENPEGEKVQEYTTVKTEFVAQLPPGVYKFKVNAILEDGTIGDPSPLSDLYTVWGAKILPPRLSYKKDKEGNSILSMHSELRNAFVSGILEYQNLEGDSWNIVKKVENQEIKDLPLSSDLNPGKYKVTLKSLAKGFTPSENASLEFIIKPKEKDLESIDSEISTLLIKNSPP